MGNNRSVSLSEEVSALVRGHRVFSGGERHRSLIGHLLPHDHDWIPIKGKMERVMHAYEQYEKSIVIFVSGDPFFYGFGNTLRRLLPKAKLKAYPHFNCLQLLSHRLLLDYSQLCSVSLHGRDWSGLDEALLMDRPLIGVLTDAGKSPKAIALRLLDYGHDNYTMYIGEELEGEREQISTLPLEEAAHFESAALNCIILKRTLSYKNNIGIEDAHFSHLPGRPGMITKRPLRLAALSALQLHRAGTFWDIGSCTGSMAIEAKRMYPGLQVTAFEKREECRHLLQENTKKFRTPGISIIIADAFDLKLADLQRPEAIFIGGHGNRLEAMMLLMNTYLQPGGILVMNTVKPSSADTFEHSARQLGLHLSEAITIKINDYNTIQLMTALKPIR